MRPELLGMYVVCLLWIPTSLAYASSLRPLPHLTAGKLRSKTESTDCKGEQFMRSSKGSGPGLNDDLTEKMHKFMDGPATHRESHSKHLPDVTVSDRPHQGGGGDDSLHVGICKRRQV
jgi:hypothetical protein